MTLQNFSYVKTNSVNAFYLIINEINRYLEESNGSK